MAADAHRKAVLSKTNPSVASGQIFPERSEFDAAIFAHGYEATIERRLRCPCIAKNTGHAQPGCVNCGGTGHFFIDKQSTVLLVSGINNINKYQPWSQANIGTISVTARPPDKFGFMDKITLTELEMWFSEVVYLKKGSNNDLFSFLVYQPVNVFEVYLFKSEDEPLIFVEESDYSIVENKIVFNLNNVLFSALLNPAISIRYTHRPSYFIIDINRDLIKQRRGEKFCNTPNGNSKTNLPVNAIARLAHYVLDAPNYDGNSLEDNTNYEREIQNYDL